MPEATWVPGSPRTRNRGRVTLRRGDAGRDVTAGITSNEGDVTPGRGDAGGDVTVRITSNEEAARSECGGHRPAGGAAAEEAAAEERALERVVAVHAATPEAAHLTGRVDPRHRL